MEGKSGVTWENRGGCRWGGGQERHLHSLANCLLLIYSITGLAPRITHSTKLPLSFMKNKTWVFEGSRSMYACAVIFRASHHNEVVGYETTRHLAADTNVSPWVTAETQLTHSTYLLTRYDSTYELLQVGTCQTYPVILTALTRCISYWTNLIQHLPSQYISVFTCWDQRTVPAVPLLSISYSSGTLFVLLLLLFFLGGRTTSGVLLTPCMTSLVGIQRRTNRMNRREIVLPIRSLFHFHNYKPCLLTKPGPPTIVLIIIMLCRYLRETIIRMACSHDNGDCLAESSSQFQNWERGHQQ